MKNISSIYLATVLLALTISSCQDNFETIRITNVKNFLPEDYMSNKSAIFKDANLNEQTLAVNYSEKIATENLPSNQEIENEQIYTTLVSEDEQTNIIITGGAYIHSSGEKRDEFLSINLNLFSGKPSLSTEINITRNQIISMHENNFSDSVKIINRTFLDVYSTIDTTQNACSEIYYNPNFGIIGFVDKYGEKWEFLNFEE